MAELAYNHKHGLWHRPDTLDRLVFGDVKKNLAPPGPGEVVLDLGVPTASSACAPAPPRLSR